MDWEFFGVFGMGGRGACATVESTTTKSTKLIRRAGMDKLMSPGINRPTTRDEEVLSLGGR